MVSLHPSKVLTEAFKRKPYQGTAPESADLVFIGLDANYSPDIEASEVLNVIFNSGAKFIFMSAGVQSLLKKTKLFAELSNIKREFCGLKVLFEDDHRTVFQHLHFSNYGKFEQQLQSEARAIASLIPNS